MKPHRTPPTQGLVAVVWHALFAFFIKEVPHRMGTCETNFESQPRFFRRVLGDLLSLWPKRRSSSHSSCQETSAPSPHPQHPVNLNSLALELAASKARRIAPRSGHEGIKPRLLNSSDVPCDSENLIANVEVKRGAEGSAKDATSPPSLLPSCCASSFEGGGK